MSSHPLVSVITPFYNTPPQFMKEAIDSVIAQTYPNWELLLIDDGALPESTSVALRYAEQHPQKIRYLEHEGHRNRGIGPSVQMGMDHARGEFIALLDSDDLWLQNKLDEQLLILKSLPGVSMLYGNTLYWHSWTGDAEDSNRDYVPKLGIAPNRVMEPPELCSLLLEGKIASPVPCSILVKREAVDRVGGYKGIDSFIYTDQKFYVKIFLEARVFVSDQCWDWYRQHPGSRCSQAATAGLLQSERIAFLNWVADYLSRRRFTDPTVWRALHRERWLYRYPTWLKPGTPVHGLTRRAKKRLLWMEERVLPFSARRRLWARARAG